MEIEGYFSLLNIAAFDKNVFPKLRFTLKFSAIIAFDILIYKL